MSILTLFFAESDHSESHSPCSPKLCYGCKNPIEDEYRLCVTPDLQWHASCLVCSECHTNLDESCTCFLKEGRPYCKKDYVRSVNNNYKFTFFCTM